MILSVMQDSSAKKYYKAMTIPMIIERLENSYAQKIMSKLYDNPAQKNIIKSDFKVDAMQIRDRLCNSYNFMKHIYPEKRGVTKVLRFIVENGFSATLAELQTMNDFDIENINTLIENLGVFAIPSPENAVVYAFPIEYEMKSLVNSQHRMNPDLSAYIANLDDEVLKIMLNYHALSIYSPRLYKCSDLYAKIVNNALNFMESLDEKGREMLLALARSGGIMMEGDLKKRIGGKGRYTLNELLLLQGSEGIKLPGSLFYNGLLISNAFSLHRDIDYVFVPDEFVLYIFALYYRMEEKTFLPVAEKQLKKSENIYSSLRKIFVAITFLSSAGKKRDPRTISKYVSMNVDMIHFLTDLSSKNRWIEGSSTKLQLTFRGIDMMVDRLYAEASIEDAFRRGPSTGNTNYPLNHEIDGLVDEIKQLTDKLVLNATGPLSFGNVVHRICIDMVVLIRYRALILELIQSDYYYWSGNHLVGSFLGNSEGYLKTIIVEEVRGRLTMLYYFRHMSLSDTHFSDDTTFRPDNDSNSGTAGNDVKTQYVLEDDEKSPPSSILPDHEIIVGISSDFNILQKIAEFSDLVSVDRLCVSRISESSLLRYSNNHGDDGQVLATLRRIGEKNIPENVKRLIDDVSARKDEVSAISAQFIITVKDPIIIDSLLRSKEFQKYFGERLSPNAIIVKQGQTKEKVLNAIKKKGYIVSNEKSENQDSGSF